MDCISLELIHIPSSVTCIGANAFRNCMQLKYLELHDGLDIIMENAFHTCKSLEHLGSLHPPER